MASPRGRTPSPPTADLLQLAAAPLVPATATATTAPLGMVRRRHSCEWSGWSWPWTRTTTLRPPASSRAAAGTWIGVVDMVPLVESLMDRRTNPSCSRHASCLHRPRRTGGRTRPVRGAPLACTPAPGKKGKFRCR